MRHLRFLAAIVLAVLFVSAPTGLVPIASVSAGQVKPEKKEVRVWVNTKSGVYHCPGSRWYGKTKQGKYMGECAAQKEGYRPAYGRTCGSGCEQRGSWTVPR